MQKVNTPTIGRVSKLLLLSVVAYGPVAAQPTATLPRPLRKPMSSISPASFKAHVQYLADDKLRGRQPGTPGYQLAVDYVVAQLQQRGVQPAGENGTFLQTVRLRRAFTESGSSLRLTPAAGPAVSLIYGQDFTFYPNPQQTETTVDAGLVFAGFGISAPELGYDDYAGLDVKGKIVVVTRQEARQFPDAVRLYNTDLLTVLQTARRHGAVGVLLAGVKPTAKPPEPLRGMVSVLGPDGKVAVSRSYVSGELPLAGSISAAALHRLFAGAAQDTGRVLSALRAGRPASVALLPRLQATQRSRHQDVDSYNVVGKIEGTDPQLRNEYVVHTAHLDHLGVGAPIAGDSIYNGAHDNATGVATLLEIGGVYQQLKAKQKPKRSVLITLVTGEELGLLGSAYFARNPTVPRQQLVANVNTDMPTIIAPLLSVVPLGAENSSLAAPVATAAQALGLTVEADPEPAQNRFIRSDQYSFVTQGIPALHIKYGNKTADGRNNLSEQVQKWRAVTYHKPQDDINGEFDFEAGRKYAQLNFLIGYLVANDAKRPTWNPGNFFGERFGK
ncbi:M28 family peptidase [Hymenobacter psychrotolerans]|uniref:Zn-dependent amino-or carboxypeptidase, M28 family n=1 Tax=Hymenobacter psychrotolerans DSM 18569 TaxID=1121959 RepID=A0A1M6T5C8_9BACT|nr:M28 family peptidase [Hymenobacter psychrotolerans]SHK52232.1 Zn-dependent amino-or carboxypeptidase, M28 family [Hymenobacter psychrotolerans DSM 18569]